MPYDTVLALSEDYMKSTLRYDAFFLCVDHICDVAYYAANKTIMVSALKVPLWYKKSCRNRMICYCRQITLNDVFHAVRELGAEATPTQVVRFLNKENEEKACLYKMPTGKDCGGLFFQAVEIGKSLFLPAKLK